MKLTLLGTSAGEGYPGFWCECPNCAAARRMGGKNVRGNGCSMLDEDVLIDMNEHFFEMTPRMDIHPAQIDTLLVTHPHRDHFTPMLLSQRAMPAECVGMTIEQLQAYISPSFTWLPMLHVYGNRFVEEAIRAVPGLMESAERCRFTFHRLEAGTEMQIKENLSVLPIASIHTETPGFAYNYIIRRDGKTLLYASDTGGYTPDMLELVLAQQYDCVVMEGTFGLGAECEGHMCLRKNIRMRDLLTAHGCWKNGVNMHLTHICPHWAPPHDESAAIVAADGMELGYDGQALEI